MNSVENGDRSPQVVQEPSPHAKARRSSRGHAGGRTRMRVLVIGAASLAILGISLALVFPLRAGFVEFIAEPFLDAIHDVGRWIADRSQLAIWATAVGTVSLFALLSVRPPIARRRHAGPRPVISRVPSDREILIRAIRHGHRRVLYRVIVARQMTSLALRLIRQRERCSMEAALTRLQHGAWPAPDSVKEFLDQRLPATTRELRVPERIYAKKLSETLDFLERYAEGDDL